MTSVFFVRHSTNIYNIIVFQTWHLHLWHQCIFTSHLHSWYQCFSDMTSTLMTSAFLRLDINIYDMCISDMTSTLMTSVFLRQVIYIYNISVFLDLASTFMTFMFFRHDISIDDISVFHMISNETISSTDGWWRQTHSIIGV